MHNILKIFKRDCHLVGTNLIAMVVAFGLVVIPSLYAWFNIAAEWDPYSNTGGIRVAVANDDAGYTSELMPLTVNMGEQVESALRENSQLEWIFTSSDEAVEGVRSGEYYAALVIPHDFTKDMLNVLTGDSDHPTITYYSNQKESAIAPKVTDQGADTVRTTVNQVFTETITEIGAGLTEQLADYLDSDQLTSVAGRLTTTLTDASADLRNAGEQVDAFASLLDSTTGLVGNSGNLVGNSSATSDSLNKLLADGKSDADSIAGSINGVTDAANSASNDAVSSLDELNTIIEKAYAAGDSAVDTSASALESQASKFSGYADSLQSTYDTLGQIIDSLEQKNQEDPEHEVDTSALAQAQAAIGTLQGQFRGLSTSLTSAAEALRDGQANNSTRDELLKQIVDAKNTITTVTSDLESQLTSQAQSLSQALSDAQTNGSTISSSLQNTMSELQNVVSSASSGLSDATSSLTEAATTLTQAADDLDSINKDVNDALASGDLDQVRQIIANNPQALAESISDPIGLDTEAIWKMENTGSSMAAYFSTLATWVGCVVLSAMVKVQVSQNSQDELDCVKPRHLYFGRFLFFWMLGIFQSTLVGLGDILYLNIQCENPALFMVTIWIASTVFMSIVYALVVSFGDVGKAIGVVFMVLQVAGAGGIFPVEVMPDFFQVAYPFLPFVHSMNMMKFCIAGGLPGEWLTECAMLLAFIVPALLLGLVLRKPVVRLNNWFMEKLEETKLM